MFELMPFATRNTGIFDMFDSMERGAFGGLDNGVRAMRTDVRATDNGYELEAELPGFNKEDIHIDLEGDMLSITAEHKEESEEKKKGYVRRERRFGSFARSFDVSGVDVDNIKADYTNGVLKLELPNKAQPQETARRIELQ